MPELKERFSLAEGIGTRDLWGEVSRRAAALEAPPRAVDWPPALGRRLAAVAVALAVFATAAVFAWDLSHPDPSFGPSPTRAVDLASELPEGWSELPAPPEVRTGTATVWTGSQVLVWGGYEYTGYSDESSQDDGFVYDASSRTWSPIAAGPLDGRSDPAFAWTGDELLIWGGRFEGGGSIPSFFADGAAYDPSAGTWRSLAPAPIDGRAPFSVWTGSELVVWGSTDRAARRLDGAAYNPVADRWRPIAEGPVDITDGSAVWSGDEMLLVGAALDGGNHAETRTAIGAAYDPEADVWHELPASGLSPQAMTAAWLNGELVAWDYDLASEAYDPGFDSWRSLPRVPLEFSECRPESVSTTRIVFGEFCGRTVVFTAERRMWERASLPESRRGCCSNELVAAGDVVLAMSHAIEIQTLEAADRRMFVYNPPVIAPDPPDGAMEPDPFVPATHTVDGETRMPFVFPDGSAGTLVYPTALGLAELGVQPDVSYVWKADPPPRFPILFRRGRHARIQEYVDGTSPVGSVNSYRSIEIWAMSDEWSERRKLPSGHWLRYELPSWTVLVAIERREQADEVAADMDLWQTAAGFPVAQTSGPIALSDASGEGEGPRLSMTLSSTEDTTLVDLEPERCTAGPTQANEGDPGDYGSSCLAEGRVTTNVYGAPSFVRAFVHDVRIEDFRPA